MPEFEIGEKVIVNGIYDDRTFDNILCKIVVINDFYKGNHVYLIKPLEGLNKSSWWVSSNMMTPVNMKPKRIRWYHNGKLSED